MTPSTAPRTLPRAQTGLDDITYALDQAAIVAATDRRGRITYVNAKFCEISQYSREELLGRDHRIINSGHHPRAFMQDLWRTIAGGRVWRGEICNRAKDGSHYWVDTTIVPFMDQDGRPRQYLAIRNDITARRRAETQLREQASLAQLGQLAAVVAHEVRNPLAGLRAGLQVIDGRTAAPRDRGAIAAMIARIDDLNNKVEDLLLYARPRAPRLQPVPLRALLHDVAGAARAATHHAGATPRVSGDDATALADPDMLRAAVLNLAINACQAAAGQEVDITLSGTATSCRIDIADRGPGIAPAIRERVFEPFVTTRVNGTGLGLAIVHRLLDLQDAAITLSDRDGGGTVATVSMPRAV